MRDRSNAELRVAAFLFVIVAVPTHGQLAQDLDIWLTGEDCRKVTVMSVVWDDADRSAARLPTTHLPGTCHWTAHADEKFDTDLAHFSLRLGFARTECHKSQPMKSSSASPWRATLDFSCCSREPARTVTIRADPQVFISYLRRVPGNVPDIQPSLRATPCIEVGSFNGAGVIDHVQSKTETLHVQLGRMEPDPRAIGLQMAKLISAAEKTQDGALAPYDVVHVYAMQLVQGNRSAPTTSSNAIDVEVLKVRALQLKQLHVEAK